MPALARRGLMPEDLETISSFAQSPEEMFYVSPKFDYPLTPEQILTATIPIPERCCSIANMDLSRAAIRLYRMRREEG